MGNPSKKLIAALIENVVLCRFSLWKTLGYEFKGHRLMAEI